MEYDLADTSASCPRMQFDMESQIRQLEQEAYRSVLWAFKAQSDAISWEKEGLITELRKELRVSDDKHRELLTRVNVDDIICTIREWRKASENHTTMFNVSQSVHDLLPSQIVSASWKKQKASESIPLGHGTPMQGLHYQTTANTQPLTAAAKWAPSFGAVGKMPKAGQQVPGLSSMLSARYPSTGPTPRGLLSNNYGSSALLLMNDNAEAARRDSLIGRKVMTRWPADNNFYEAVITDYNPQEGWHALVYDRHTLKEAWEWIDLKEIPSEDIRWVDEDPGLSRQTGLGKQGSGDENHETHGAFLNSGRGQGATRDQFEREFPPLQNGVIKKASDDIEILHTDSLIKEVQKVFNANHPDLLEIEKAKKLLKEHEQALMNVISKLADASNSERDGEQRSPRGQSVDREQRWRSALYSGSSHGPCLDAETSGGRGNGSVMTNGCLTVLDNQEEDIVDI